MRGYFPGREKQGCFSRSLHGRIHGGRENTLAIQAPERESMTSREPSALEALRLNGAGSSRFGADRAVRST